MSKKTTEEMIQEKGLTAPRVTPDRIASVIVKEEYHRLTDVLTMCVLTLTNGFTVTGESACASPENFDEEIGRKIARDQAVSKVWMLEGYLLKSTLSIGKNVVDSISRVCHEVNKAYCEALGDASQISWEQAPDWQKESARLGVLMHMGGDHGPEASHRSWSEQKVKDGWVYGPVKDPEAKEHPCLVPFEDLPREQQAKDFLFRAVVHALR